VCVRKVPSGVVISGIYHLNGTMVFVDGCAYRGGNVQHCCWCVAALAPIGVLEMVWTVGGMCACHRSGCTGGLWDVCICVVAIFCQDAGLNMSVLVESCGAVGGCSSGDAGATVMFLLLCWCWGVRQQNN